MQGEKYLAALWQEVTPMGHHMLKLEDQAGYRAIWPDNAPEWLPTEEWSPWPVLSIRGGELFIVAINAKVQRRGAFKRLIAAAYANGLSPVVVCPTGLKMPAIMRNWHWENEVKGSGWERRSEWRPLEGWTLHA